ncbi:MAG: glycosyltransferase family 4 protein, partial [Eggerthella lenta]
MRILYFSQFYKPENIAASFRATEHSRIWVRESHDVTVFTGWPNYPVGRLFDGYEVKPLVEELIDGVRVFRSASKIQPNTSFAKRIESGVSFIANGLKNLGKKSPVGSNYDVVLVTCGTVFAAWLGVHYAKKCRLPLVVEFRDLTYKQMLATGSRGAKVAAMKSLELSFCKAADCVVALTDGFKKDLEAAGVPGDSIVIVPNGADVVACKHMWDGPLRFGYFGTMGLSQDVPATVEYVKRIVNLGLASSYELIGEGAARDELEQLVATGDYGFLKLEHGVPMAELEPRYAGVHMTVVSLQKSAEFSGTIPSKIFQSFARGVPVLFVGPEGDASELVRRSGAGIALCGSEEED